MAMKTYGVRIAVLALGACLIARVAAAQLPDSPYVVGNGRVTFGGEIAAVAGKQDTDAFFNYTDYDHDAFRTVRLRLLGQWRLPARISLLGELRTENQDRADAAALYVRWRPWARRNFDIQAGRIPPVVGAFARHAYGRDNPLIGTPLAYQYLTSLRPDALPITVDDLLRMRARGWRPSYPSGAQSLRAGIPLISSSRWDTGVEAHLALKRIELSGALTRGAAAVPVVRETNDGRSWSGRAAISPIPGLTLGFSGERGKWVENGVLAFLPASERQRSIQSLLATDLEYGRGHLLVRGEWLRSGFQIPLSFEPGPTTLWASAGFLEARYRWHPRWQIAGRADRLGFSQLRGTVQGGALLPWDAPVQRVELALGFRPSRNFEVRAGWQKDWRDGGRVRRREFPALQLLYWF
jgi:hypothetical protein